MREWFTVRGVNPEPWTSPGVDVGRAKGSGKLYGKLTKDTGLVVYQQAVADELKRCYPDHEPVLGPVEVGFYVWRQLATYEGESGKVQRNIVDATNMQKALEDAIEDVLIGNDREVVHPETWVMEQGPQVQPLILIQVVPCVRRPDVARFIDPAPELPMQDWEPREDVF